MSVLTPLPCEVVRFLERGNPVYRNVDLQQLEMSWIMERADVFIYHTLRFRKVSSGK